MKEKYELTEEHRAQLKPWADLWIERILRTDPMTEEERLGCVEAVQRLYEVSGLKPPAKDKIYFSASPLAAFFDGAFTSEILKKNSSYSDTSDATWDATRDATSDATWAATWDATSDATRDATSDATRAATSNATLAATSNATLAATWDATRDATWAATLAATSDATRDATSDATWAATRDATRDATRAATRAATSNATLAATLDATSDATSDATRAATLDATSDATSDATRAATRDATWAATMDAIWDATRGATWDATRAATWDATWAATRGATSDATRDATSDATSDATRDIIDCAIKFDYSSEKNYLINEEFLYFLSKKLNINLKKSNGYICYVSQGNMSAQYDSFLTFFRHIVKIDIDWDKYDPWEYLAIHSGYRFMHKDFCIISDFPEIIKKDEQNRPHCETGPCLKWRDGTSVYYIHGIKVPVWLIETPKDEIDPKHILAIGNTETRAAAMRFIGLSKFLDSLNAELIDSDNGYKLFYLTFEGVKIGPYLYMKCPSTGREFLEGVGDPDKYQNIDPTIKSCSDALRWRIKRASENKVKKYSTNIFQA